jgi:hypothetical protein
MLLPLIHNIGGRNDVPVEEHVTLTQERISLKPDLHKFEDHS